MQCIVNQEANCQHQETCVFLNGFAKLANAPRTVFLSSQRASVIDLHVCILMYFPSGVHVINRRTMVAK
jgi:hypothetical protein